MPTSRNGTSTASSGACRPAIAPRSSGFRPVTEPRIVTGLPIPPKATGAVLASSAMVAAFSGAKPAAMSITAQMAIGEPPPASASMSAPKENAMTIAWILRSSLIAVNARRSTAKCPVSTVRL
jgi:hypothetical protein